MRQRQESVSGPATGADAHPSGPLVDLADDTFVACAPTEVARVVADPVRWATWWPDLRLTSSRDRGLKGQQWTVHGTLVGTAEIWLEPWWDGVLLHHYLRADRGGPAPARGDSGWAARERQRRARSWKAQVHRLKDELETGRLPGEPSVGVSARDGR